MTYLISTLPDKWCIDAAKFSASYHANKIYLGRQNNLERTTYVVLEWIFEDEVEQKEFFDWWRDQTDNGGIPFYAKMPLFADDKHYMVIQSKPFVQSIAPIYKISGQFMLFKNKTRDHNAAPVTKDVIGIVDINSVNNVIMLDVIDPDGDTALKTELVGVHTGLTVKGSSVIYAPTTGFLGVKTFHYKTTDGTAWSNTSKITITVKDVNAPTARDIDISVAHAGGAGDNKHRVTFLNGFDDNGRALTYHIVSAASHGTTIPDMHINEASITVTSSNEVLSFTYKVNNGIKDSLPATATVRVINPVPLVDVLSGIMPKTLRIPNDFVSHYSLLVGRLIDNDDVNGTKITYTVKTTTFPTGVNSIKVEYVRGDGGAALRPKIKAHLENGSNTSSTFNLQIEADNKIEKHTFDIPIEVVSTVGNDRYKTINTDKKVYVHLEGQGQADMMFNLHPPYQPIGYPEPQDFPDVLYWDSDGTLGGKRMDRYVKWVVTDDGSHGDLVLDMTGARYSTTSNPWTDDHAEVHMGNGVSDKRLTINFYKAT